MKYGILILGLSSLILILVSCYTKNGNEQRKENVILSDNLDIKENGTELDECANKKAVTLLNNEDGLKKALNLTNQEFQIIRGNDLNQKKKESKELILKLLEMIVDDSILFDCTISNKYFVKVAKGDMAVLGIYRIEPFPFAKALGLQSCSGKRISPKIHLPQNLFEMISYNRKGFQDSLKSYLKTKI